MNRLSVVVGTATLLAVCALAAQGPAAQEAAAARTPGPADTRLGPTSHPPVPSELSALWYAPPRNAALTPALANFVKGVRLLDEENKPDAALPLLDQKALATTPLADYARFYTARALMALGRHAEAEAAFAALASAVRRATCLKTRRWDRPRPWKRRMDFAGAAGVYERLLQRKLVAPHVALWRLGLAAQRHDDQARAIAAFRRVYLEFPLVAESRSGRGRAHEAERVERGRSAAPRRVEARRYAVPGSPLGCSLQVVRTRARGREGS